MSQFGPQQGFFQPGFYQPAPYPSINQEVLVTQLKEDIKHKNGSRLFDSFHNNFYFENGNRAFDSFHNNSYYMNSNKAFDGFNGNVFYSNGNKAYDGFYFKAKYENGQDLGRSGVRYSAENVSMNLTLDIDEFFIHLGQNFYFHVGISEVTKQKKIRLYMGQMCVLEKIL